MGKVRNKIYALLFLKFPQQIDQLFLNIQQLFIIKIYVEKYAFEIQYICYTPNRY
jgi:hypothetical protein